MDIWVRREAVALNSVVITIVGRDDRAHIEAVGHLRDGEEQHFVMRHSQEVEWPEEQFCGSDWLRDALTALAERI